MIHSTPIDWDMASDELVVNALQQAYRYDKSEPHKGPHLIYVDYRGRVYVRPPSQPAPFRCRILCRESVQLIGNVINQEQS